MFKRRDKPASRDPLAPEAVEPLFAPLPAATAASLALAPMSQPPAAQPARLMLQCEASLEEALGAGTVLAEAAQAVVMTQPHDPPQEGTLLHVPQPLPPLGEVPATYRSSYTNVHLAWTNCLIAENRLQTLQIGAAQADTQAVLDTLTAADLASTGLARLDAGIGIQVQTLERARATAERVMLASPTDPGDDSSWLLQAVPAAAAFLQQRAQFDRLVTTSTPGLRATILDLLGVARQEILEHNPRLIYRFASLTCLRRTRESWSAGPAASAAFRQIAAAAVARHGPGPASRIALIPAARHALASHAALLDALKVAGFLAVNLQQHDTADCVRFLATATAVVAINLDVIALAAFCRPGTRLVSIQDNSARQVAELELYASLKLDFRLVSGALAASQPADVLAKASPPRTRPAPDWLGDQRTPSLERRHLQPSSGIPRNIFMMWDKPRDQWPPLVRVCVDLWRDINPGWDVQVYDLAAARAVIGDDIPPEVFDTLKVQHQSDLLRTKLLSTRGGVWADASCLPHMPADRWISAFDRCDYAGIPTLMPGQLSDNWFMVSQQDGFIMGRQYEALKRYWKTPKINLPQDWPTIEKLGKNWRESISDAAVNGMQVAPYFLWHFIFRLQYECDTEFQACFDQQRYLSTSGGCGALIRMLRANHEQKQPNRPLPGAARDFLRQTDAQLSKLNHHSWELDYPCDDFRAAVLERAASPA